MAGIGISTYSYEYDPVRLKGVVGYVASSSTIPAGYTIAYDEIVWSMNVPVSFGFQFTIGKRWCCGTEAIIRKYFDDKIIIWMIRGNFMQILRRQGMDLQIMGLGVMIYFITMTEFSY